MKYDRLTQYIEIFQPSYSAGTCFFDKEHSGTADDPIQMPFVMFDQNVRSSWTNSMKVGLL